MVLHKSPILVTVACSDTDLDDANEPSAYEKAVMKRIEENHKLMKKLGLQGTHIYRIKFEQK